MMDIVERLRRTTLYQGHGEASDLPDEAADEIERLREALRPFAELGAAMLPCDAHDTSVWVTMPDDTPVRNLSHYNFIVGDFRNATKALGEKE